MFWIGAGSSLGWCTAIRLPIVIGYVAGSDLPKKRAIVLTCLFAVGMIVSYILLGTVVVMAGGAAEGLLQINKYVFWILGLLLIVAGILLSGLLSVHSLSERWPGLSARLQKAALPGAVLLGALCGLMIVPGCPSCGAGLLTLAGIIVAEKLSVYGLLLFTSFALGQSLPVLGVGVLTAMIKRDMIHRARTRICSLEERIQLIAGNVLMILGFYLIVVG